jgi:hypothetical protein
MDGQQNIKNNFVILPRRVSLLRFEYTAARLSEFAFLQFQTLVYVYAVHDHYQLVAVDISYRENSKQNGLSDWVRNCSLRSDSDYREKAGAAVKHLGPFEAICTACCV